MPRQEAVMSEHDIQQQNAAGGPRPGDLPQGAETPGPRVEELGARVRELEDAWKRALAEAENMRKRMERETERVRAAERAHVAAAWLPVLDNLDLALEHAAADPRSVIAGVEAIRDQALGVVAGLGFPRRNDVGAPFDPTCHEAVSVQPLADAVPGTVVSILRPGYGEADRPLRPAAVVVAAAPPTPDGTDAAPAVTEEKRGAAHGRR
jgi:molecular chaperone GrpE